MTKTNHHVTDLGDVDTIAASNKGAEIELLHPATQEKLGIFWSGIGRDSDAFKDMMREDIDTTNRRNAQLRARGKQIPPKTFDEQEDEAINLLVVCSTGWRTVVKDDRGKIVEAESGPFLIMRGEKLEFNVPNAKRVLREMPWIRRQIDEAIGDMELFMKS